MASLLDAGNLQALQGEHSDEEETALLIEKLEAGSAAALPEGAQTILAAKRIMANPEIPSVPVPEVLKNIIARSTTKEAASVPGVVLRMTREGIDVIKSSLRGIVEIPQSFVAVRSAGAAAEQKPRVELQHSVQGYSALRLEYQVVRESDKELMLSVRFVEKKAGSYRVKLTRDNRLVDSRVLAADQDSMNFSRLSSGFYELAVSGPIDYKLSILVEEDL